MIEFNSTIRKLKDVLSVTTTKIGGGGGGQVTTNQQKTKTSGSLKFPIEIFLNLEARNLK